MISAYCLHVDDLSFRLSARFSVLSFGASTPCHNVGGTDGLRTRHHLDNTRTIAKKKGKSAEVEAAPDYERFPYVESVYEETAQRRFVAAGQLK